MNDYDEAIQFYTQKLGFILIEDTQLNDTKRWVKVDPSGSTESCLLLAKASCEEQSHFVGNQSGGRVFLFLHTDDFWRDYHQYSNNNSGLSGSQLKQSMEQWRFLKICTVIFGTWLNLPNNKSPSFLYTCNVPGFLGSFYH